MAETDESDKATVDILEDVALLARKLADQEPFKSATGHEALQAFAAHLESMVGKAAEDDAKPVTVPVRRKRRPQ